MLGDLSAFTMALSIGGLLVGLISLVDIFHSRGVSGEKARNILYRFTRICIHHDPELLAAGEELKLPFKLKHTFSLKVCGNCKARFLAEKCDNGLPITHRLDSSVLTVLEHHYRNLEKNESEERQIMEIHENRNHEGVADNVRNLEEYRQKNLR